jgi:hypothetical protein
MVDGQQRRALAAPSSLTREVVGGEPPETRTLNRLIKSQLLYH